MPTESRTINGIRTAAFAALLFLFLFGLVELFQMRFRAGDIYPVYSSLRTDPLGTGAFYEALGKMPGLSVSRNYRPLPRLDNDTTLFLLGVNRYAVDLMNDDEIKVLEAFVSGGGRLVMTFLPAHAAAREAKPKERSPEKSAPQRHTTALGDRWGFRLSSGKLPEGLKAEAVFAVADRNLPASVSWHTTLFFDGLETAWETIYKSSDRPVLIEKRYGKGTIVLATDTYFASNEAVLRERHPDLLAWLAGAHKSIIFDESHNGILENPGVASLFRKYRLHGVFAGFLLLAVLFIWKNSVSLVPRRAYRDEKTAGVTSGRDHLSGFVSLLRRCVPPRKILSVCVREWKKGLLSGEVSVEKMQRVEKTAWAVDDEAASKELQADAYRAITIILSERTTHGK